MKITATVEKNAQQIGGWWNYDPNPSHKDADGQRWWDGVRLVGWISQNKSNLTTVLYLKWQRYRYNYYPYSNDRHTYSVGHGGSHWDAIFALTQSISNATIDLTGKGTLTFQHSSSTGEGGGTLSVSGYKCWENFTASIAVDFPAFDVSPSPEPEPPEPEPEPEPPAPIVVDNNPRYYIYADGNLVYAAGIEGYEILNPKLTLEVNKAGSLTFEIPVGSEMHNNITLMKATIDCMQGNEVLFRGRVLSTKRNIWNTITYYCEGFLSWFVDMSSDPWSRTNISARELMSTMMGWYNGRASANRQIEFLYSDISANVSFSITNFTNYWELIKEIFIDGVGGYIVPYLTPTITGFQWLSSYSMTSEQVIQFGTNLLDFSESIDASDIYTSVRPYGKEVDGRRVSVTGTFINDEDAEAIYGHIERVVIFDEITTESALRSAAESYLRMGSTLAMSLSISAVDLHLLNPNIDRLRVGDSVRVISVPHNIDAYFLCTKAVMDLQDASNTVFTLGATQRTISELTDPSYKKFVITEGV